MSDEHTPDQAPGQSPGQTPDQSPGQTSGHDGPPRRGVMGAVLAGVRSVASAPASARRARTRPAPAEALALLLPVAALAVGLAITPSEPQTRPGATPTTEPLRVSTTVCPLAPSGRGLAQGVDADSRSVVLAATGSESSGDGLRRRLGGDGGDPLPLAPGRVTTVPGTDPVLLRATAELAPGLVAVRTTTGPLTAAQCPTPVAEAWFPGAGAGAKHRSVLRLANPAPGRAVVSISLVGARGTVAPSRLQGLAVPPGGGVSVDLSTVAPTKKDLAVHVVADRGRVAATVQDTQDPIVGGPPRTDYLTAAPAPAETLRLLGFPTGRGQQMLTVANPGDDEVAVDLRLVTADSVFAPSEAPALRVPPQSSRAVPLQALLSSRAAEGALGLELVATGPVTAGLRSTVEGDLTDTPAAPVLATRALLPLPDGDRRLVLAGATRAGVVRLEAWRADGTPLDLDPVEVSPGRGVMLDLPDAAVLVSFAPARTEVQGAVQVVATGPQRGAAVLPLLPLLVAAQAPAVVPGLP